MQPKVTLKVSPEKLNKSGEWVTLTWAGVPSPSTIDWIGVYSPASVDPTTTAPIKFQYASKDKNYLSTGSGTLRFHLLNMRGDYVFHFFRSMDSPVLFGTSNKVSFQNYNEPLQPHLSLTNETSQMRLTWVTRDARQPIVRYGTASGTYIHTVRASTGTYNQSHLCGAPANTFGWRDPGLIHTAVMTNLLPNTRYYYQFGDSAYGFSEENSFMSAPSTGSESTINVLAFGDMGKATKDDTEEHWEEKPSLNTTERMLERVNAGQASLLLHIGDIAYAVGYSAQWDQFFDQIAPIASRIPYQMCIGNHERDFPTSGSFFTGQDSGGECGVPYESRFFKPSSKGSKDEPWYSINYGNTHFLFMSTEHDFRRGTKQYEFIENDLQNVDRKKTPWLVFAGHRPMYIDSRNKSPNGGDQPVAKLLREHIEELLMKYRVDLALWGHHHSYQRTCPVYQEECQPAGTAPVHVVIGMGGMGLSQNLLPVKPAYMEFVDDKEYGFTTISIAKDRLHMQFFSDVDGGLRDQFVLQKK